MRIVTATEAAEYHTTLKSLLNDLGSTADEVAETYLNRIRNIEPLAIEDSRRGFKVGDRVTFEQEPFHERRFDANGNRLHPRIAGTITRFETPPRRSDEFAYIRADQGGNYQRHVDGRYGEILPEQKGSALTEQRKNVEDLLKEVRQVSSSPRNVSLFLDKISDGVDDNFTVDHNTVIGVVDTWPGACQSGRDQFLSTVDISRQPASTPISATIGLVVVDRHGDRWWNAYNVESYPLLREALLDGTDSLGASLRRRFITDPVTEIGLCQAEFDKDAFDRMLTTASGTVRDLNGALWLRIPLPAQPDSGLLPCALLFPFDPEAPNRLHHPGN